MHGSILCPAAVRLVWVIDRAFPCACRPPTTVLQQLDVAAAAASSGVFDFAFSPFFLFSPSFPFSFLFVQPLYLSRQLLLLLLSGP